MLKLSNSNQEPIYRSFIPNDEKFFGGQMYEFSIDRKVLRFVSEKCKDMREAFLAGKILSAIGLNCIGGSKFPYTLTDKRPIHFFDVYDNLNIDRNKEYSLLEIGNRWCGSLWGWRAYLPNSYIYGLDIDPDTQYYANNDPEYGVKIYEGDQTDVSLLKKIHDEVGKLDIVIDDGGHTMSQMETTFKTLWPLLEDGGYYIIEDLQCCYWPNFEGGLGKENSFIEYIKSLIDNIHACYYKSESIKSERAKEYIVDEPSNYFDKTVQSIEIYDSIAVIRKGVKDKLENRSVECNFIQEILNYMLGFSNKDVEHMGMEVTIDDKQRDKLVEFFIGLDDDMLKMAYQNILEDKEDKQEGKEIKYFKINKTDYTYGKENLPFPPTKSKDTVISFIIPSRNNLRYLKWCYNSIRKNLGYVHEICIADDGSEDGTWKWLQKMSKKDTKIKIHRNKGPERQGLVVLYDKLVKDYATNDVIMIFHADMYACPGLDKAIFKHLKKGTIVCATRVEPSLHPPGPEKIVSDYGIEPEEFDEQKFLRDLKEFRDKEKITHGIFAPWAIYKDDFWAVGGHDELFSPTSREDSDIFNRFKLNGCKFIQTWDGMVYHLTSRGSRFNSFSGGEPGKVNSEEWIYTNTKNIRNFIRKWGTNINHDKNMMPMVTPKYDIGFVVKNCNNDMLRMLEPWCSTMYVDIFAGDYIKKENENTLYDLNDRIYSIDAEKKNDIEVRFDGSKVTQDNFNIIQQLSAILSNDGELEEGSFELDIFEININKIKTYEKDLIKCEH